MVASDRAGRARHQANGRNWRARGSPACGHGSRRVTLRGLELSVDEAKAVTYGQDRRVHRRVYRRHYRYARRTYRRAYYAGTPYYYGSPYYYGARSYYYGAPSYYGRYRYY